MKKIKIFAMLLMVFALSVNLSSCKGDVDEPAGIDDYYEECTSVSGGSLSSQDATEIKTMMTLLLSGTWTALSKDEVLYLFEKEMKKDGVAYLRELYDDYDLTGTVKATVTLYNSKQKKITSKNIICTRSDCYVE